MDFLFCGFTSHLFLYFMRHNVSAVSPIFNFTLGLFSFRVFFFLFFPHRTFGLAKEKSWFGCPALLSGWKYVAVNLYALFVHFSTGNAEKATVSEISMIWSLEFEYFTCIGQEDVNLHSSHSYITIGEMAGALHVGCKALVDQTWKKKIDFPRPVAAIDITSSKGCRRRTHANVNSFLYIHIKKIIWWTKKYRKYSWTSKTNPMAVRSFFQSPFLIFPPPRGSG